MNAHRTFGFLAAVVVMVGQVAVFAVDTAAVAQTTVARTGYVHTLDAKAATVAGLAHQGSDRPALS